MRRLPSAGSMWMSLARSLAASTRISLTSLTTEASWAILAASLSSASMSSSSSSSSLARSCTMAVTVSPPTPKCVLMRRAISHRLHLEAGERLQLVEGVDVERVAGGDDESAVLAGERHHAAAVNELERHGLERIGLDGHLGQIDHFHAEFFGEGGEDVFFLGEASFNEDFVDRLGGRRSLSLLEAIEFGGCQAALLDEPLRQLHLISPSKSLGSPSAAFPQVGWEVPKVPATGFQGGVSGRGDEN